MLISVNTTHQSPLVIASSKGDLQIVELLLKYNFNPNICNINGLSPLSMTSERGHIGIVKLLLIRMDLTLKFVTNMDNRHCS